MAEAPRGGRDLPRLLTRDGSASPARVCGECSLCCTLLRVDELAKLGGTRCVHQRSGPAPCSIHVRRPGVCRSYRCLWLDGWFEDHDRPDRVGAVFDATSRAGAPALRLIQATPDAVASSSRLRELTTHLREVTPIRITDVEDVMDPEREVRWLLAGGEEERQRGKRIEIWRDGRLVEERRLPWIERVLRDLVLRWRRRRLGGRETPR